MLKKLHLNIIDVLILICCCFLLFFSVVLACVSSIWKFLTIHEILYHLTTPFNGIDLNVFQSIYDFSWPVLIGYVFLFLVFKKRNELKHFRYLNIFCVFVFVCSVSYFVFIHKLNVFDMMFASKSGFVEEHYVHPENTKISFESRRNLIHIYLESMETTYSNIEICTVCGENLIPLLTEAALKEVDFSNNSSVLNGANPTYAASWTAASIFAQNLGIPLIHQYHKRIVSRRDTFAASTSLSLPKILRNEGYDLYFLAGSDSNFASKDLFLRDHGDFKVYDYNWFVEQNLENTEDKKFWGVDDQRLLETAKKLLTEFSSSQKPFVLNILTVDTHPYGFLPASCQTAEYPFDLSTKENLKQHKIKKKEQFRQDFYREVIKCSDKTIVDFIEWIKQQPFYENTTVVITGDHLVQSHFLKKVDDSKRRSYVAFLNSAHNDFIEDAHREYNLFDLFPTILSSLGAKIDGDRLGLGTNLFSSRQTLTEQFGEKHIHKELEKRSELLSELILK